MIGFSVSCN